MRKFLTFVFLAVVMVLSFAAANYIVIGTTDKIRTLDPANCYDYFSSNILFNVLAGPVDYKIGSSEIIPWLFEKWTISADGLTYTFYIKKGAKFEDGTEIDANVFKWSWERVMKLNGDPAFLLGDIIDKIDVVDKYTLKVKLKYKFSAFVSVLGYTVAFPMNPKTTPEDKFLDGAPSASGPYRIAEWQRDVKIVLEANPKYFGPAPKTPKIIIQFFENSAQLRMALETGQIDVAYRHMDPRDILDLKQMQDQLGIKVYLGTSPQIRYLVINVKQKPFDNVLVRQALAYAVDREVITKTVFQDLARPLYSLIPMGWWSHKDVFPKKDVKAAVDLLKKAGYSESKPLTIDLWYTPSHYGSTEADVAQLIKRSLEETKLIKINIKYAEWSTYVEYFLNGTMGLFLLGWYPDYLDPDDYVWPFLSKSGGESLGSFYENKQVENLMMQARAATDIKERTKLYELVQAASAKDVPYIPLWQGYADCEAKNTVSGIVLEPTQIFRYYTLEKK
ncbi:MAG: ABC transporter substrate-binding protein [Fervidobacterium sp.]